jgi:arylsulfatase A-like enzyme
MTGRSRRLHARRAALLTLASALAVGCARRPTRPPILLITLHGIRADVVDALRPGPPTSPALTPQIDAFAREATWSGRAVAASSASAPALAALFTGLRPWQTQVLYDGTPLSRRFATLPSALAEAGYTSAGFSEQASLRQSGGFIHGFEVFPAQTLRAEAELDRRLCAAEPSFLWAHFDLVSNGYTRHDHSLSRVARAPRDLPDRIRPGTIEGWNDPATPMTPAEHDVAWALYRSGVAEADAQAGVLLDALRACRRFDDALVIVAGDHGEAFGENGIAGHGGSLGRAVLEVPLLVKLPRGMRLAIPADEAVSTTRLFATVLTVAGLPVPPGVEPSLFLRSGSGAESEAFRLNGENQFSLVAGDFELLRTVRYAAPDPEYYAVRRAFADPDADETLSRHPRAILHQLTRTFRQTTPFEDHGAVTVALRRWPAGGGAQPVADAALQERLAAALERAFRRFVAEENTPAIARRE